MKSFEPSRLKIYRASIHIAELEREIRTFEKDAHTLLIEPDTESQYNVIHYGVHKGFATQLVALIIGDAIHNLKTALDFAWVAALDIIAPGFNFKKDAKFPVNKDAAGLKSALINGQIYEVSPNLVKTICEEIRPYKGGNDFIYSLHRLDIRDKHRLLIPTTHATTADGIEFEDESGNTVTGYSFTVIGTQVIDAPIKKHLRVKNQGKVSLRVLFGEGPAQGALVPSTLKLYSKIVLETVEALEAFCEAGIYS